MTPGTTASTRCGGGSPYDEARGCLGTTEGSLTHVEFENDFGNAFALAQVRLTVDGQPAFDSNEATVLERDKFPLYSAALPEGRHRLRLEVALTGQRCGPFAYLQGYRFEVRTDYELAQANPSGGSSVVRATGYEKGGPTTPLEERPAVRWQVGGDGYPPMRISHGSAIRHATVAW